MSLGVREEAGRVFGCVITCVCVCVIIIKRKLVLGHNTLHMMCRVNRIDCVLELMGIRPAFYMQNIHIYNVNRIRLF